MNPYALCACTLALHLLYATAMADDKGETVARRFFALKDPKTSYSKATMVLVDNNGRKRTRTLEMYGKKDEQGTWSFIEFLTPATVKGTRFLTIPHAEGDDEQRLYLPALRKTRTIAASSKDGTFVGSDFFYYDMEDRAFEDYTYTYLREETLEERDCHVIKMETKDPGAPYAYAEAWVDKGDNFVYRTKMYDRRGGHIKTLIVVETKTIDGCIIPTKVVMENHRDDHKTLLAMSDIRVNEGVDDNVFTVRNLERK